ncbi:UpxY family transcription antiterminator [Chitinophaga pinensis]|uniref:UpxY family transcription antiterminator n=1 Tax=Chitinophaga pinensis TaxID=79329 RepID=A0A5C6LJT6_9BACT|nr:UpxY family transcription antiterminator [Chitinophaga pinensis]TWV90919.1 UpxY family transcription antiterminator [Chitinophaga pinensis]
MSNFVPGWRVIYTRPNQEKRVSARLHDLNVDAFLPLTKARHQWHDRVKVIETPLFPSYVFVNLHNVAELNKGLGLDGVVKYVRFGSRIATVENTVIDNIRLAMNTALPMEVTDTTFQPGQHLVITEGPLSGFDCELIDFKGAQKALVRVQLLNRNFS